MPCLCPYHVSRIRFNADMHCNAVFSRFVVLVHWPVFVNARCKVLPPLIFAFLTPSYSLWLYRVENFENDISIKILSKHNACTPGTTQLFHEDIEILAKKRDYRSRSHLRKHSFHFSYLVDDSVRSVSLRANGVYAIRQNSLADCLSTTVYVNQTSETKRIRYSPKRVLWSYLI